jgi:hypothetical protein
LLEYEHYLKGKSLGDMVFNSNRMVCLLHHQWISKPTIKQTLMIVLLPTECSPFQHNPSCVGTINPTSVWDSLAASTNIIGSQI